MLEELLNKEKEDRIESLDTQLEPINQQIDKGYQDLDDERSSRVNKEREILELLQDEATIVENHITTEQEGRLERQAELTEKLNKELQSQRDRIEKIKSNTLGEFKKDHADM